MPKSKNQKNSPNRTLNNYLNEKTILAVLLIVLLTGVVTLIVRDKHVTKLAEPFTTEQNVSE